MHTLVKSILLFMAFIMMAVCSKNNHTALFQFQADGTTYSFDSATGATIDTSAGVAVASMRLYNTKTKSAAYFEIQSNTTRLPGTYSHINPTPAGLFLVDFGYTLVQGTNYNTYVVEGTPFTFTVTAASNGNIQGYFSGKVTFLNTTTDATIASGQFKIPFSYQ